MALRSERHQDASRQEEESCAWAGREADALASALEAEAAREAAEINFAEMRTTSEALQVRGQISIHLWFWCWNSSFQPSSFALQSLFFNPPPPACPSFFMPY